MPFILMNFQLRNRLNDEAGINVNMLNVLCKSPVFKFSIIFFFFGKN